MVRTIARVSIALGALAVVVSGTGEAVAGSVPRRPAHALPDTYGVPAGGVLDVAGSGVLSNDRGDLTTVVAHTRPVYGTLTLQPDGSFRYVPQADFAGTDTFTYTTSDAVDLYQTTVPPLASVGGVSITGGAYGSSLVAVPGSREEFYGLTDRGPNVDGPNGSKVEPLPDFTPAIGRFRLVGGEARLERRIPLSATDGTAYDGQVNCQAGTGELITDLDGTALPCSPTGYDPEGLVALPDGTFWVSDEYGPFITHFDNAGRQIDRLSPFDGSLPGELANRLPNRGMEGLTVTPDGSTLVGIMQSALRQPDVTAAPATLTPLRVVTYHLRTHEIHEYLYLLDDPLINVGAVSEITALSNTTFAVVERDGRTAPGAYKKIFRIDLGGATDIGPDARVPGAVYEPDRGLLLGSAGASVEAYVGTAVTSEAVTALAAAGITPAHKSVLFDLGALVTSLDPAGGFFGHDKIEGISTARHGRRLIISNDSDFGISGLANTATPFQLNAKILPNGQQDDGALLGVDLDRLPAATTSTTVTIQVRGSASDPA